jgi:hypothetical protein
MIGTNPEGEGKVNGEVTTTKPKPTPRVVITFAPLGKYTIIRKDGSIVDRYSITPRK